MDGTAIGLSKKQSYAVGTLLVIISLSILVPCGDDLLVNIPMSLAIHSLTGLDIITSLLLTYTIIPISILLVGVWIYPGSTINNLKKRIHKASKIGHRLIYNPFIWLIAIGVSFLLWQYYTDGGSSIIQSILNQAGL